VNEDPVACDFVVKHHVTGTHSGRKSGRSVIVWKREVWITRLLDAMLTNCILGCVTEFYVVLIKGPCPYASMVK